MLYDITLTIGYTYATPSDRARTLVHLLPLDLPGRQTTRAKLLTVTPDPQERSDFSDFFGNIATMLVFHQPLSGIELVLKARIACSPGPQRFELSPRLSGLATELSALPDLGPRAPHHFVGPSRGAPRDAAIAAFAEKVVQPGMTAFEIVAAIGAALFAEMQFDSESTDVDTSASVAFANRHGVCQDFSHVMITALRALGIPAGYVSGFLRTVPPPGQERLEGADAMHAWVCAWCGAETGWVEYDPTNACSVGADHVVVAYGRDYSDVAPVRGVLRTAGAQTSRHAVDVVPLADAD